MGLRVIFRRITRSPLSLAGLLIVVAVLVVAAAAPWIATHDPVKPNLPDRLQGPSAQHLFGTDKIGRDIFSRVVHGTRISLGVGLMVVAIAFPAGTALGVIAAYYGGRIDSLIMRLTDIFLAVPSLVLAMAIAAALGPSIENTHLALAAVWWPWYTRIVRSLALSVRESEYVQAARSLGAPDWLIIFRHVLPNSIGPAVVTATLDMGFVILNAAGLSFIGLGAQPPSPEWGAMLATSREILREAWWAATFPGLAILVTVLGFNLVGDGFRDAADPVLKGR